MKRRQFLQNIAAVATVPTLPSKVFAGGATASTALYAKAVHYTRLWGTSVPEMYTSALGLNHEQAHALFGQLVRDNVIATPNASGIAQAVAPYFKTPILAQKVGETVTRSVKSLSERKPIQFATAETDEIENLQEAGHDDPEIKDVETADVPQED